MQRPAGCVGSFPVPALLPGVGSWLCFAEIAGESCGVPGAGRMELAQIPRGIKRGFVVCEWLPGSLSSPATPAGANGPAIPAAFLPKLLGPGRAGGWDRCSGVKNAPVQRVWRDHHDPHLGYPSGRSGNLNSALALCLGIIRSRKSEALSRGGS